MAEEIFNNEFQCPGCSETFNFTNIAKLQHLTVCKKKVPEILEEEVHRPSTLTSNQKLFKCEVCLQSVYMTNIEILKHRKSCKIKIEID